MAHLLRKKVNPQLNVAIISPNVNRISLLTPVSSAARAWPTVQPVGLRSSYYSLTVRGQQR